MTDDNYVPRQYVSEADRRSSAVEWDSSTADNLEYVARLLATKVVVKDGKVVKIERPPRHAMINSKI